MKYLPMMDEDVADLTVPPTKKCWSDIKGSHGVRISCRRPGDYVLGLCEEHAVEIVGHPEGAAACSPRRFARRSLASLSSSRWSPGRSRS